MFRYTLTHPNIDSTLTYCKNLLVLLCENDSNCLQCTISKTDLCDFN